MQAKLNTTKLTRKTTSLLAHRNTTSLDQQLIDDIKCLINALDKRTNTLADQKQGSRAQNATSTIGIQLIFGEKNT